MATYYISSAGADASNGLGPDASHATNKPWLTLGKALNTGSPVVPGDTVKIGPGILYEGAAAVLPIAGVSSTASPTVIEGDPTNAQGFKDGGGVRLPPGICHITTRTAAEGFDGPIASTAFTVAPVTGCHGLQWYNVSFESKTTSSIGCVQLHPNGNADWVFEDCRFTGTHALYYVAADAATAGRNLIMRRCLLLCPVMFLVGSVAAATANADLNIQILNNLCFGNLSSGSMAVSASGGNLGGGIILRGNTFARLQPSESGTLFSLAASRVSTVTPFRLEGNLILAGGIANGTAGQSVDDGYNRFFGGAHTNFTPAGTSLTGFVPHLVLPDLVKWGLEMPRPECFGWTDAAHANQHSSAWGDVTPDFWGRTVRPWGAGASIGCWDTPGIAQDTGGQITGGGANSLKLTGKGEASVYVPVDAVSTTLAITTKSTGYGGTNWAQLIVMPNPAIGVAVQTITATSAAEQTLSTAAFTPTGKGLVEIRFVSRSSSLSSATFFDTLAA